VRIALILLIAMAVSSCGKSSSGSSIAETALKNYTCPVANITCVSTLPVVLLTYSPSAATNGYVVIDASNSTSPSGKPLTYNFTVVSAPANFPGISGQGSGYISFFAQYTGTYKFSVTASDGTLTSMPVIADIQVCCDITTSIADASTFVFKFPALSTAAIQSAYRTANPVTLSDIFRFGAKYQLNSYQLEFLSGATPGSYQTQILTNGKNLSFAPLNGGATISGYTLNIPNTVQIPGDLSQIKYPADYAYSNSRTNTVEDPYCNLSDTKITFNASDIGSYALPIINAVALPASALRIAQMKDTWQINNPSYGYGCTKDMATAIANTMARLATLNVNAIALTPWGVMQYNANGSSKVIDAANASGSGMTDAHIAWYVKQAHAAGMKVIWVNLIQTALNPDGSSLSSTTTSHVTSAYAALDTYFAERGAALQAAGVDGIILGPWHWTNFENYQTPTEFINSNVNLITTLRKSFSGKVYFALPSNPKYINASLNSVVDAYIWSGGFNYSGSNNPANFSVTDIFTQLRNSYSAYITAIGSVPIIWDPSVQSRQGFFTTNPGYYDPFCTQGGSSDCQQLNMAGDFSLQAVVVEASMEFFATHLSQSAGFLMNYVRDSNLLPPAQFNNMDATVRGKPAEYIYYKWFNAH
jgi:hypothetical protein